jgi:hypothetical protein
MKSYEVNKLALESSDTLLDIDSYINIIDFKIDPFVKDQFWKVVSENRCVQVVTVVLGWLGYDCARDVDNKAKFIKMLESHNIDYKLVSPNDNNFNKYPEFVAEYDNA